MKEEDLEDETPRAMYKTDGKLHEEERDMYRDYFYYACKHRLHIDGKRCDGVSIVQTIRLALEHFGMVES